RRGESPVAARAPSAAGHRAERRLHLQEDRGDRRRPSDRRMRPEGRPRRRRHGDPPPREHLHQHRRRHRGGRAGADRAVPGGGSGAVGVSAGGGDRDGGGILERTTRTSRTARTPRTKKSVFVLGVLAVLYVLSWSSRYAATNAPATTPG